MHNVFWGCPFLSVLFLFAIVWAGCTEHLRLKRCHVQGRPYWQIMLLGLWLVFVTAFAILWLVTSAGPRGALQLRSLQGVFLVLVLAHNRILKPIYKKQKQRALNQSSHHVWVR